MLSASRKIKDDGNIIFMDEARTARESMDGHSMARLRDARDRPCYGYVWGSVVFNNEEGTPEFTLFKLYKHCGRSNTIK